MLTDFLEIGLIVLIVGLVAYLLVIADDQPWDDSID